MSESAYLTTMSMDGMLMTMTMTTTMGASATASMDMSSSSSDMDMDMDMSGMNEYFTSTWRDYPVIFSTLKATNSGQAFGIFLLLFVVGFLFRGLSFMSAYLEQKVFHNYNNAVIVEVEDNCECADDGGASSVSSNAGLTKTSNDHMTKSVAAQPSKLRQFLFPGANEFGKDLIRLGIAFLTAMFGYVLMVAAMSYVILYFFAVVLGIAFGEVFFNRWAIVIGVNKNSSLCSSLH